MQVGNVSAARGVEWFKRGWTIFAKDMKNWVLMALVLGVGAFVLEILPIIGQIAMCVLMPALLGGMLYAAKQASSGAPVKLEYLWMLLTDAQKRNQFLALGGIVFAAVVTVGIISAAFVGDSLLRGASSGFFGIGFGGLLFLFIMGFVFFVLFSYTPALMIFRNLSLFDALQACAKTASTQVVPLLVFFLIYSILAVIASLPFGLGWLVLLPIMAGAVYTSYTELFTE